MRHKVHKYPSARFLLILGFLMFAGNGFTGDSDNLDERVTKAIELNFTGVSPTTGEVEIEVNVTDDHDVVLDGVVGTYYDKLRLFEIASKVKGVKTISNKVVVRTEPVPDEIIEKNIRQAMQYNDAILEPDDIKVNVDNGLVILDGKTTFFHEKRTVETIASWQKGVRSVANNIEVLPPDKALSDANLEEVITEMIDERFPTDASTVTVAVEGRVASVTGKVDNFWSKYNIEEDIQDVIGIKDVKNYLKVADK